MGKDGPRRSGREEDADEGARSEEEDTEFHRTSVSLDTFYSFPSISSCSISSTGSCDLARLAKESLD
jgi:hypothetical protein